ncbi:hypothetical protein Droror1_Dr00009754 [Drosera rotundifolia]
MWLSAPLYGDNGKTMKLQCGKSADSNPGLGKHLGSCLALEDLHLERCQVAQTLMLLVNRKSRALQNVLLKCWRNVWFNVGMTTIGLELMDASITKATRAGSFLVQDLLESVGRGRLIDLHLEQAESFYYYFLCCCQAKEELFSQLTLDVIGLSVFNYRFDVLTGLAVYVSLLA